MKFKTIILTLTILFTGLLIQSCAKKEGCTDPNSINYDPSAEKDNGTCTYKGSVVFFENAADNLGYTIVTINDGTTGVITLNELGTPSCGASGCFTYTAVPGTYTYSASDQSDNLSWNGSFTITSDGCSSKRLTR